MGRCYAKERNVSAQNADTTCHKDNQCDAWFWQSNTSLNEMTSYTNRSRCIGIGNEGLSKAACEAAGKDTYPYLSTKRWHQNDNDIYLWLNGYENPALSVAGNFSPDCWANKVCCDKKACFQSRDPMSEACRSCCPGDYNASLVGKPNGKCMGAIIPATTASRTCPSTEFDQYDVKCSKCIAGKETTMGTAYFYQQGPDQRTKVPAAVSDAEQEARVMPIIACKAGITSWGGVKQDRNFDLLGISGFGLWVFGLAVVACIFLYGIKQLLTLKSIQKHNIDLA